MRLRGWREAPVAYWSVYVIPALMSDNAIKSLSLPMETNPQQILTTTMTRLTVTFVCIILALLRPAAEVITDTLVIHNGDRQLFGILSRPAGSEGKRLPVAVIAHGFNGDHKYGMNYFGPLAEAGYMCYTFDFPCGGVNSTVDNNTVNMSVRDEVSDLTAAVNHFAASDFTDRERIVLIGESQGGLVASLTASAIPDRIHKLILCFPALGIPDNYNSRFDPPKEIPDTTYIWKVPIGKRFFTELRGMRPYEEMRNYHRPVLLLHGDKDPVVPLSGSERAVRTYSDACLKVIKGAGHGFGPEDFRLSTGYIRDFLRENGDSRSLEEVFLNPRQEQKPLIIWQWMDGLVTREGITRDLEAFREAGLAGVQNFQIGGPMQMRVGDPTNAIGSDNWKELLRWALDECERLGLTFGTHNCPGWSSSAYVDVLPEYSMQKLVYSETPVPVKGRKIRLPRPEVDPQWDYYADVAVMAVPADSAATLEEVVDLTPYFNPAEGMLYLPNGVSLPAGGGILRIGQTTNGKTNYAQAPESGRGLECDKLSREAVLRFWNGYPSMVIETAGRHAGKTFTHFEIDSYEAGGQTWSPALTEEFRKRAGYDLTLYLPYMAGRLKTVGDEATTAKFLRDWEETVKQCVAENYYGYLTELAGEHGITMLIEPYGTGHQQPFTIIDFEKIARACEGADIATEFWQAPDWGWKDMRRHEASMRRMGRRLLVAEAFTCWPLRAWSDSPATIKPVCDRAFCTGVNRMMLHAGAANPWPEALPGMSFGMWGTHFVPGQTWWRAGGARELFGYMARCQALLQQGIPAPEQLPAPDPFKTYRRTAGDTDILFVCNPADTAATCPLPFDLGNRSAEIWDPYTCEMYAADADDPLRLTVEPYGSRFVIVRPGESDRPVRRNMAAADVSPVEGKWTLAFPEGIEIVSDTLFSWPLSDNPKVKYFSGTATYSVSLTVKPESIPTGADRLILSLGDVRELACVRVNGKGIGLLWKAPYECDITDAVKAGENTLEIEVTNLWPNRMIGDELEPDDLEWSDPFAFSPTTEQVGRFLLSNPDWLRDGTPRPSAGRKTVGCFKFFKADSPLLPSGLLGPVALRTETPLP